MTSFILRRLLLTIPVLLGVSLLTFAIIQVTPGDPARLMLGDFAAPEQIAAARQQLGLDDPLWLQYGRYVWRAVLGDLGVSIRSREPVLSELLARLPSTLELLVAGMGIAVLIGIPVGVFAATTQRRWADLLTSTVAIFGLSVPSFFLAIVLLLIFGVRLRWVSVTGGQGLRDLILPALCIGLAEAAVLARMTRAAVIEVMNEDYVRTARAKGLSNGRVLRGHVLRNSLIPIVTVLGLQVANLLAGAVFIESVFARPGLGRYAIDAIAARDFPQVQGMVLFTAVAYVLLNLTVDVLYGVLDPRIRRA